MVNALRSLLRMGFTEIITLSIIAKNEVHDNNVFHLVRPPFNRILCLYCCIVYFSDFVVIVVIALGAIKHKSENASQYSSPLSPSNSQNSINPSISVPLPHEKYL